jgi:outer membrane protein TolC
VAAANEALRFAEEGYKGGTATAPDVRDAEASLADARAEEAQSLMDYWTARASLDHATGVAAGKGN